MTIEELERDLRARLDAFPNAARGVAARPAAAGLGVGRIQDFWASPETRSFGELLIDIEEDPFLRIVLIAMIDEGDDRGWF